MGILHDVVGQEQITLSTNTLLQLQNPTSFLSISSIHTHTHTHARTKLPRIPIPISNSLISPTKINHLKHSNLQHHTINNPQSCLREKHNRPRSTTRARRTISSFSSMMPRLSRSGSLIRASHSHRSWVLSRSSLLTSKLYPSFVFAPWSQPQRYDILHDL